MSLVFVLQLAIACFATGISVDSFGPSHDVAINAQGHYHVEGMSSLRSTRLDVHRVEQAAGPPRGQPSMMRRDWLADAPALGSHSQSASTSVGSHGQASRVGNRRNTSVANTSTEALATAPSSNATNATRTAQEKEKEKMDADRKAYLSKEAVDKKNLDKKVNKTDEQIDADVKVSKAGLENKKAKIAADVKASKAGLKKKEKKIDADVKASKAGLKTKEEKIDADVKAIKQRVFTTTTNNPPFSSDVDARKRKVDETRQDIGSGFKPVGHGPDIVPPGPDSPFQPVTLPPWPLPVTTTPDRIELDMKATTTPDRYEVDVNASIEDPMETGRLGPQRRRYTTPKPYWLNMHHVKILNSTDIIDNKTIHIIDDITTVTEGGVVISRTDTRKIVAPGASPYAVPHNGSAIYSPPPFTHNFQTSSSSTGGQYKTVTHPAGG